MPTTALLRRDIARLAGELGTDLNVLWRKLEDPAKAAPFLHDVLPALIEQYGLAAGSTAADWYDARREQAAVKGRFRAIPANVDDVGAHVLIGYALKEAVDYASFKTLLLGGAQRRVANFSRFTVMRSSTQDRQAKGWERVGVGECDFCAMLLGRGAVYSEATADFEAHDHCQCQAEPVF